MKIRKHHYSPLILRATLSFLSIIFSLGAIAQDQPLQLRDILENHYKAIGLEKKKGIHSLVSIGALNQLGSDLHISIIQKRPSFYRMDVHLEEGRITQAFDGKSGWMLNPFLSADTVSITGQELDQLSESAVFDGILVNYESLGYEISYDAAGVWNEIMVHILKLSKDGGTTLRVFLDAKSFLILKTEANYTIEGLPVNAQSEFSDYQKVDGVYFPYKIINRNGQFFTEMKIDTIRINERLDDLLFK